jgi:exopolysaccharide production protein ExoZ
VNRCRICTGPFGGPMRYANIQVLRVAAAVGVVLYHLGMHAPGSVGVDPAVLRAPWLAGFPVPLFFAVSGFVLAHAVRSAPPGRFLFARFLRLYPGYWLALAVTAAVMWFGPVAEPYRHAVGLVNQHTITLWPAGSGRVLYLIGVEWSLVYEVFLSAALAGLSLFGPRRLPVLAVVWLAAIAAGMIAGVGGQFDTFPTVSTIALSAHNIAFILGVLAYHVKDRGRRWRWAVLPATLATFVGGPLAGLPGELVWWTWGAMSAAVVWLAVQFPQMSERNPLARLGDCTYGLYLAHVPLLTAALGLAARYGWTGRAEAVWAAGAVALVGGLLFGRLEAAIHTKLRPLTKWKRADVLAWPTLGKRAFRLRFLGSKGLRG